MRDSARALLPVAAALAFQGGFAAAVMALAPDDASHNVGYVILVEFAFAALCLCHVGYAHRRRRREISSAVPSPLRCSSPPARGAADACWLELLEAAKAEALREIASREARSAAELDDFLASVHAIKTPATALSLMAEKAEREGGGLSAVEVRLEIDELDRAVDRSLARLRLIDFEKGSRLRRFDVAELARSSVRRHRRLFIARSVSVRIEGSLEADSDPDWISFILDQLVSNAAKHAASCVLIELKAEDGLARGALIEVSDDGPGFDAEDSLRAFERSAAGGPRLESAPSPSGYGLYLAREAALRLGSRLELVVGEGARLRLTLPLSPGPFGDRVSKAALGVP